MKNDEPMSLEEAKRYFDEHVEEFKQKAERQALNYLAMEKAIELARTSRTEPGKAAGNI